MIYRILSFFNANAVTPKPNKLLLKKQIVYLKQTKRN